MENRQVAQEEEIDIRDVVMRRKKLIGAIFLLSVVATAIISLRCPKVYEVASTVQLGIIHDPVIKNEEAKAIMLNQNLLLSVIHKLGLNMGPERLERVIRITDVPGTRLLNIRVTYPGIDAALKINDVITQSLIDKGQIMYREQLAIFQERLNELEREVENIEDGMARTRRLLSDLSLSKNPPQGDLYLKVVMLQNDLFVYEDKLTELRDQKNKLKLLIANARDFGVFSPPARPHVPIGPQVKKNIVIAAFMSFCFAVFLAFFIEFFKKCKNES
jgi:capsular polysaccharide biosynthesis protein